MTAKERIELLQNELKELECEAAKKKAEIQDLQKQQVTRGCASLWRTDYYYCCSVKTSHGRNQKIFSFNTKEALSKEIHSLVSSLQELDEILNSEIFD